jgi:RES domain-containing protein
MELWRISNYADLSGIGGVRAAGRWHSQGRRIVYLADHPSSALLEMLVHMDRDLIPSTYQLLRIVVPPSHYDGDHPVGGSAGGLADRNDGKSGHGRSMA